MNLFFRILKRRSDGYHEIASLYQAVSLCDFITLEKHDSDVLTCSDPQLACDHSNLAWKALSLFRSRFSCSFGVKMHLDKRIPMQAGLGGGSSNAATVLWGLNELTGGLATLQQLMEMGAMLGSDVPFFFSNGTAYCTGRGEKMEPFSLKVPLEGWIVKPPYGLSTPLVYQETDVSQLIKREPRDALDGYPLFYNDLEPAAFRLEPRLANFQKQLQERGFFNATMTGSGTAFFCIKRLCGDPPKSGHFEVPFYSVNRLPSSWYSI